MKYFIKLFALLILLYSGVAVSVEVTISGAIKDENGSPLSTPVILVQPGELLPGGSAVEQFKKIGSTRSLSSDGVFEISFDNVGLERVIVAAWYKATEYYIYSEVDDIANDIVDFNIVVPAINNNSNKSVEFFINRNGSEIDYKNESFIIAMMRVDGELTRHFANLTTKDLIFNSNKSLYDLPDGEYRVSCTVAYNENGVIVTDEVFTTIVLPLSNDDKKFVIDFVSQ